MDPDIIEHLLLYTTLSRIIKGNVRYGKCRSRPLTKFAFLGSYPSRREAHEPDAFIMDVKPTDLSRSLDHAVLLPFHNAPPGDFLLEHVYQVAPRELRGLPFNPYPIRFESSRCRATNETLEQYGSIYFYAPSDKWIEGPLRNVPPRWVRAPRRWTRIGANRYMKPVVVREPEVDPNYRIAVHLGFQFIERYDWYVLLGFEDLPKLQVFVDPHSVRELFEIKKVIDPIEGRKRLIHWVTSHKRAPSATRTQAESTSDDWIHVCEHLRGCYEFGWRGLNCWLIPSEFDRDRLPARTKHAEIWK